MCALCEDKTEVSEDKLRSEHRWSVQTDEVRQHSQSPELCEKEKDSVQYAITL